MLKIDPNDEVPHPNVAAIASPISPPNISSPTLLTINSQPVSLAQSLNYLQCTGNLQKLTEEIARQHIIYQHLPEINITRAEIEQTAITFRQQHQLTEPEQFQHWLQTQGLDESSFHQRLIFDLRLQALKTQIAAPKIQQYFIQNKLRLDRIVLSRIVVASQGLAEEIKLDITEGKHSFESLARQYSLAPERSLNGMLGEISRADFPEILRAEIDAATIGTPIGPFHLDNSWWLLRIEARLSASLDWRTSQQLETEIFEQWLTAHLHHSRIQLAIAL